MTEEEGVVEVCAAMLTGALAISLPGINFTTADFIATYGETTPQTTPLTTSPK